MHSLGPSWACQASQVPLHVPVVPSVSGAEATTVALATTDIPAYVLDYAPLVWLHSQDPYRPSGIGQQLAHTTPKVDWEPVQSAPHPLTLDNLDALNELGNTSVYLTSHEGTDANPQPEWFSGTAPNEKGETVDTVSSCVILVDQSDGMLDAFYFYFFAYNQGNTVLDMEFGNHVGDWEHNMIRFIDGEPEAIWYSQHSRGQAFTYDAVEKHGKRPIAYSGNGTHAVYSIAGPHDHTIPGLNLPFGFLVDQTDQGVLWDPVLSAYAYTYHAANQTFQPYDPSYPVNWLSYNGQWGDDEVPGGPKKFGQAKYSGGPNGPKFKHLVRKGVCPTEPCTVLPIRVWAGDADLEASGKH